MGEEGEGGGWQYFSLGTCSSRWEKRGYLSGGVNKRFRNKAHDEKFNNHNDDYYLIFKKYLQLDITI